MNLSYKVKVSHQNIGFFGQKSNVKIKFEFENWFSAESENMKISH